MRTISWLLLTAFLVIVAWKEGRGSVGDVMLAVIRTRQHIAVQQMLLDSEFARCVR